MNMYRSIYKVIKEQCHTKLKRNNCIEKQSNNIKYKELVQKSRLSRI